MKLTELELTAYDVAVIVIPGLVAITEISLCFGRSDHLWTFCEHLSLSGGILLAFAAFASGHIVNQAAYETAMIFAGRRFFFAARDQYWKSHGENVCNRLRSAHGIDISVLDLASCDRAYNHCLTIIGSQFDKRKVFSLVAAFSLSLWFLALAAIFPAVVRERLYDLDTSRVVLKASLSLVGCGTAAVLMWRRSRLYTRLMDVTVFHVFEAAVPANSTSSNSDTSDVAKIELETEQE